jgi:hypothetical protein
LGSVGVADRCERWVLKGGPEVSPVCASISLFEHPNNGHFVILDSFSEEISFCGVELRESQSNLDWMVSDFSKEIIQIHRRRGCIKLVYGSQDRRLTGPIPAQNRGVRPKFHIHLPYRSEVSDVRPLQFHRLPLSSLGVGNPSTPR